METRTRAGVVIYVHPFDSLGGNVVIVRGRSVLVLEQGSQEENLRFGQLAFEAAQIRPESR
jgi:hypothetical protein